MSQSASVTNCSFDRIVVLFILQVNVVFMVYCVNIVFVQSKLLVSSVRYAIGGRLWSQALGSTQADLMYKVLNCFKRVANAGMLAYDVVIEQSLFIAISLCATRHLSCRTLYSW